MGFFLYGELVPKLSQWNVLSGDTWMDIAGEKQRLNVTKSDLSGSAFDDVNMSGWRVRNVNLSGISVDDANMSGARIHNANLSGLLVDVATLAGAHITKANLTGVSISDCVLDGMMINGIRVLDLLAAYEESHEASPSRQAT